MESLIDEINNNYNELLDKELLEFEQFYELVQVIRKNIHNSDRNELVRINNEMKRLLEYELDTEYNKDDIEPLLLEKYNEYSSYFEYIYNNPIIIKFPYFSIDISKYISFDHIIKYPYFMIDSYSCELDLPNFNLPIYGTQYIGSTTPTEEFRKNGIMVDCKRRTSRPSSSSSSSERPSSSSERPRSTRERPIYRI